MTPLEREIRAIVAAEGPISVARYMALCLGHPIHGYYRSRDPLGAAGDFTTAPEISQMFGELLGLWTAAVRSTMPPADRFLLVELGPGRGTLLADALRACRSVPGFSAGLEVHLVETSPVLREAQQRMLGPAGAPLHWHVGLEGVPAGPGVVLANEFFDALPVRQFVRTEAGWAERVVGLSAAGRLAFGLDARSAAEIPPGVGQGAPVGSLVEVSPEGLRLAADLGRRCATQGGAALILDYGYAGAGGADTLQALRRHRFTDPLDGPGTADLTAHVAFRPLAAAARAAGAAVHGPVEQGAFLRALGIAERAAALKRRATAAQGADIDAALARLTDPSPAGMGALFKALCIAGPELPAPPGFA